MLRGGSLFYALAITVIMALVSSSILLAAHFVRIGIQKDQIQENVIRNARSGLELLMGDQRLSETENSKEVDLFGAGSDSVRLTTKFWGAFKIGIAIAHTQSYSNELICSIGNKQDPTENVALYLADLDRPLSITGNTQLKGNCYLPKSGIQRAYIEGNSYSGDKMVYGDIKTSDRFLPNYNKELIGKINLMFDYRPNTNDSVLVPSQFDQLDSIHNSFTNSTLYLFSEGEIHLQSQHISGQVCIISKKSITVGKHCEIHNALLIAPKIILEDEVEGDFQAFSSDSIKVGEKVHLQYPSVLGIISSDKSSDISSISIAKESSVFGEIFGCALSNDYRKHVLISVQKESLVYGKMYCSDLIDLQGSVFGNVICSKFELKTQSAEYENHLLNAVIDCSKRSPVYVGSLLTESKSDSQNVIQWLK